MSECKDKVTKAKALGLEIHLPKSNELFIDIDDEESIKHFYLALSVLGDLVEGYTRTPSQSGKEHRFHIRVRLTRDVADARERVSMQLLLGSDRKRELLSWREALDGKEDPTVFFEKPTTIPVTDPNEPIF